MSHLSAWFLSLAWSRHGLACGAGQGTGHGITRMLGLGGCASLQHPQALSWRQALRSRLRRAAGAPSFASNLPIYSQVPKPSQAVATCLCQLVSVAPQTPRQGRARGGLGPPAPPRYHVDYYCCVACASPRVRPRARELAARGACCGARARLRNPHASEAKEARGIPRRVRCKDRLPGVALRGSRKGEMCRMASGCASGPLVLFAAPPGALARRARHP